MTAPTPFWCGRWGTELAQRVNAENFDKLVLQVTQPVLVDFYSDTCVPCKVMSCVLGELEEEYAGELQIYKVNINYEEKLTEQCAVMAVPTIILFRSGKEVGRTKGAVPKKALIQMLHMDVQAKQAEGK